MLSSEGRQFGTSSGSDVHESSTVSISVASRNLLSTTLRPGNNIVAIPKKIADRRLQPPRKQWDCIHEENHRQASQPRKQRNCNHKENRRQAVAAAPETVRLQLRRKSQTGWLEKAPETTWLLLQILATDLGIKSQRKSQMGKSLKRSYGYKQRLWQ